MVRDSIHPVIPSFPTRFFIVLFLTGVVILLNSSAALAWGCRGHEAITLIALRDMTPTHAQVTNGLFNQISQHHEDRV